MPLLCGLMYAGIRDFTVIWAGYQDVLNGMKSLGLPSFEMYLGPDLKGEDYSDMGYPVNTGFDASTREKRRELLKKLSDANVKISAILIENDFGGHDVQKDVSWMTKAAEAALDLEVDVVRINSVMTPRPDVSEEKYVNVTVSAVKEALKKTQRVYFAMENHGTLGNKKEFIEAVIKGVSSQRFAMNLDPGNFYWFGYPLSTVYDLVKEFAPIAKHTHLKNMTFPQDQREKRRDWCRDWPKEAKPLYEGDIDYSKIVAMLKSAGYDRDLTIEDESLGNYDKKEAISILIKDIDFVKKLSARRARLAAL